MLEIILWGLLLLLILIVAIAFFSVIVAYASQAAYVSPDYVDEEDDK